MKAVIVRIVLGSAALLTMAACNPLTSSLGLPDFAKAHFRTYWYSSTEMVNQENAGTVDLTETGRACQNAIAMAKKGNHGNPRIQKIKVTARMKNDRLISVTCRVEI